MYITLKTKNVENARKNAVNLDGSLKKWFLNDIYKAATDIEKRSKEILKSKTHYEWVRPGEHHTPGRLAGSIHTTPESAEQLDNRNPRVRVGPNLRIAPYAEWVEFGHFMTGGGARKIGGKWKYGGKTWWWKGYHYMSEAAREKRATFKGELTTSFTSELSHYGFVQTERGVRIRHLRTGRFVGGGG